MKNIILLSCFLITFSAHAQLIEKGGQLYLTLAPGTSPDKAFALGRFRKVAIGNEKTNGEISILSDLIFHQDLKLFVVDPETGTASQIDLDEKSPNYGSVDIVSKLVVRHEKKLYEVNPKNGKTKLIKE